MLYYSDVPGAVITSNAGANVSNDCFFLVPGATRTLWWTYLKGNGRVAAGTNLYGINLRGEKWTATASSGGTGITPTPNDPGYQAAKHTAGFAAGAVVSGTGGPLFLFSIGFGASGNDFWGNPTGQAGNPDAAYSLQAGATQSMDVFNNASVVSAPFELTVGTAE